MDTHQHTLPGPDDITRRELPNGIAVLVRENHHSQSVVITGSLNAGSVFDPPDSVGLASFLASVLLRGTVNRDFATIHELLEGNGANLHVSGGMHTVGFGGKSLHEDLPLLLDLLADALRHPSLPEEHVERLRGQIITGLKIREQDTRYMAGRAFRRLAYPAEHPYSRQSEGCIETVTSITRAQLADFHHRHFGPGGMILIVVGAIHADDAFRLVEEKFGDWKNPDQPPLPDLPVIPPMEAPRIETLVMPGKSQSDVVLGVPGPSRFVDDWQAANLANSILGVFGMYGRIGAEVREKRGMAYYSYSRLDGGLGPGSWRVLAGVNPANVERAIESIRDEIRRIITEPVSDDELADNKANFIGRLPLQLESNEGVAGSILSMERYELGLDYLQRYVDVIGGVTKEDVLHAAQRYLNPDVYALAVAGPEPNTAE
jgi:zinc protease